MSWEAWGSGDDPFDPDVLYEYGWDSDEDMEKWWKIGEEETVYTYEEAIEWYTDKMMEGDFK